MIINKKIKRTMLENKSQYVGSLMLIIISCLLYTMFNQLSSNMSTAFSNFQEKYNQEDASFVSDKKLANIEELEKKFNMTIEETKSIDYSVSTDKVLRVFSENSKVDIPAIIKGDSLKNGGILIDPAYAKANNLKIGDSIRIYDRNFNISGFMSLPNYIYPIKQESDLLNDPNNFGIAVISKNDFNNMNEGNTFYAIKFKGDSSSLEDRISKFKDYIRDENIVILKWTNTSENPRITYVKAKIDSINQMSSSMPIAIIILTCILTGVVMVRMLKKESIIIGTLYALGYRKKEIMKHYLMYPLFISLSGGIIGTVLGFIATRPMIDFMLGYFNMPLNTLALNKKYIAISIALPIIFLVICGYFIVNKTLKYSPVDLMRGGKESSKVGFIERNIRLDKFKFSTKFKIREQLRSVPRSVFLLLGVIFATMLLLLGFASKSSMDLLTKDTYGNVYKYQYEYVFNSLQQQANSSGEVFSVSPFTLKNDSKTSFSVYGINNNSKFIYFKDMSGAKLSTNEVIITKPLADKLKVKPKDTIQVVNRLDSREYSITIDSIADSYVGSYIYMPIGKFNSMLKLPEGSYMGLWSDKKIDIPEGKLISSTTISDVKKALDNMTKPLQYSIGSIALISFVIGLIVIYVVTSLIIEENKGNISLMKVLGYKNKEVYSLILNSSSFIVVLGYVLGVPLLLACLKVMFQSVTEGMNMDFPVTIEYIYVVVGFIVIYLTYEISKVLSKKKVNKISMTEALKSGRE
ncbi:ABC transporter permease [Clostridium pasteurianum]|uniref:Putative ABC-type transport system involved in lysophospholipase L1 biosynthesis, permease component n=1 Tax=Clostridium pasteurianum BC1 TaxID=86416 RepID=R4KID0_CLOPA|nr:FtsX-like permease family protein [Clostridium pasteurianum]AGK99375.1 putative ABC-type transport system involved in lysophospholipase L1 biosynthesis, permease component [Clostridium pasteurianum BC1]